MGLIRPHQRNHLEKDAGLFSKRTAVFPFIRLFSLMVLMGLGSAGQSLAGIEDCHQALTERGRAAKKNDGLGRAPQRPPTATKPLQKDVVASWYGPVYMGDFKSYIEVDNETGRRFVALHMPLASVNNFSFQPTPFRPSDQGLEFVELMPGPHGYQWYNRAPLIYGHAIGFSSTRTMAWRFYDIRDRARSESMSSAPLDLTWNAYLEASTVPAAEISEFRKIESAIDPVRKVVFAVHQAERDAGRFTVDFGKTLAVMRVVDGSPFPVSYFGEMALSFPEFVPQKLPIEILYPSFNFRARSDFVFEMGRLASSGDFPGVLRYLFRSFSAYLTTKYGFGRRADSRFVNDGMIYADVTAHSLRKYLLSPEEKGYGFTLVVVARGPDIIWRNTKNIIFSYDDLEAKSGIKPNRRDTSLKYIVAISVKDFIKNFQGYDSQ